MKDDGGHVSFPLEEKHKDIDPHWFRERRQQFRAIFCVYFIQPSIVLLLVVFHTFYKAETTPVRVPPNEPNADEALEILNENSDIQLMFTDIDMSGSMHGLKLAAAVRNRWPPIEIFVTLGHQQMSDESLPVVARFFSKPYKPLRVVTAIREMVAAG